MSQMDKSNPFYNIPLTYHFKGSISVEIFKKSIDLLFKRHLTLFPGFKQQDGVPYIQIIPKPVSVEFIDYSDQPASVRHDEIFVFAGNESRKYFDIETDPLYRLYLIKEDADRYYFHFTVHHIIFDGCSTNCMINTFNNHVHEQKNGYWGL